MTMDHLQRLRTFVAVAQAGSFARGATAQEISASAATRAVAALERHLGALLLQRTTRPPRKARQRPPPGGGRRSNDGWARGGCRPRRAACV